MRPAALEGGFATPAIDAAHAFRALMTVMARPGRIMDIGGGSGPAPLSPAAATVLLTLCDADTAIHLAPPCDTEAVRAWIAFHIGAPLVAAERADFALGPWDALAPPSRYRAGTPDYPDRGATLIVEMDRLAPEGATLRGPGIETTARLSLPETGAFQDNARRFPLGLDFILTAGSRVAALPRSTQVG